MQFGTWYGHQLLPQPDWQRYLDLGCAYDCPPELATCVPNATCAALEDTFSELTAGLDPYALDYPTCLDDQQDAADSSSAEEARARAVGRRERRALMSVRGRYVAERSARAGEGGKHAAVARGALERLRSTYEPCASEYSSDYLNDPAVQVRQQTARSTPCRVPTLPAGRSDRRQTHGLYHIHADPHGILLFMRQSTPYADRLTSSHE